MMSRIIITRSSNIRTVKLSMRQMRMMDHIGRYPCKQHKTTETMERKNTMTMENMDIMLILPIRHILQTEQVLALGKHVIRLPEFPLPCKNQAKPAQQLSPKQVVPTSVPEPVQIPQQAQPPIQFKPAPTPNVPRLQQPVEARKPRFTDDVEMRNARPAPLKPSNIPRTLLRDPPPH